MIGRTNAAISGGGGGGVLEDKTVALNMASGDQEITPSTGYDGLSKATVTRPASLVPENIKNGVSIGGVTGTFVGTPIANDLDGLVDNTITSFTMPQGKTAIRDYLFQGNTSLTYANLQGATEIGLYSFYETTNAQIILPSTLTRIGGRAFYEAGTSAHPMELNCPTALEIVEYTFYNAKISKVSGKFTSIGNNAFYLAPLTEIVLEECTGVGASAFSGSSVTKFHININGAVGQSPFGTLENVTDFMFAGNITSINTGGHLFENLGAFRPNPEQNVFVLDLSNSTFTSLPRAAIAGGTGIYAMKYMEITLPSTLTSIGEFGLSGIANSFIFFKGNVPVIQSNTFNNTWQTTKLFVPYQKADSYRTAANWSSQSVSSAIKGYADENTFTNGQTLPTINDEGYGLTWYSDAAMTTQVTTVSDASQKYYCEVGTTLLAYKIKSITTSDCTVTISDGQQTYALNDRVLIGTNLTITSAATDPNKTQVYALIINGTDYAPAASGSVTVASDISIACLYYDGINAPFDSTLANNSWDMIKLACDIGRASSLWAVGDTKTDSEGNIWRIVDFQTSRYARASGTGYTNCVFMMDKLIGSVASWRTSSNSENYSQSLVNSALSAGGALYTKIDQTLAALVDGNKVIVNASQSTGATTVYCTVGFFAPCYNELGATASYGYATTAETVCNGTTFGSFDYFVSNTNSLRIRRYGANNTAYNYWLRSRYSSGSAVTITPQGGYITYTVTTSNFMVCPCFAF